MRASFSIVSPTAVRAVVLPRRLAYVAVCSMTLAGAGPRLAAAQPNEPHPTAVMSAPLPVAPTPPSVVQPMVTSALLPGHWQLEGARYVWVPPDKEPRPVVYRPLIEGRYVYDWGAGSWVWNPLHFGGD